MRAGRDPTSIERLVGALETELPRVTTAIIAALPSQDTAQVIGPIDRDKVHQVLTELEPMLVAGNIESNWMIERHAGLLKAALGTQADALIECIEQYRYPEALEAVRQFNQKLN